MTSVVITQLHPNTFEYFFCFYLGINCTLPPYAPPMDTYGVYNWIANGMISTFETVVNYT